MDLDDPAQSLLELFLLGLTWLREEKPDVLTCRGASVFSAYRHASPVFSSAGMLVANSWDLAELLKKHSHIHTGDKRPSTKDLRIIIADSGMYNVILAIPPGELRPEILFGPNGYSHVVTDAGMEYANNIAGKYEGVITSEAFHLGWRKHATQMKNYNAKRTSLTHTQGGSSPGDTPDVSEIPLPIIPRATLSEEDFEW